MRYDVKSMGVRQAIEPVVCAEGADRGVLDLVDTGACSKEAANRPRWNVPRYRDLNRAAPLSEAVELGPCQICYY
jgi:hypothetical protein